MFLFVDLIMLLRLSPCFRASFESGCGFCGFLRILKYFTDLLQSPSAVQLHRIAVEQGNDLSSKISSLSSFRDPALLITTISQLYLRKR